MIGTGIKRGTAELAVLSVLEHGPLHGYEMARRIEQQTKGVLRFTLAALYPMLYRMEQRGWIRGAWKSAGRDGASAVIASRRPGKRSFHRSAGMVGAFQCAATPDQGVACVIGKRLSKGT